MRVKGCFEAADWGYVIEASLLNPLADERFPQRGRAVFKVDTGFSGPVLVTNDIFELLHLPNIEVPEDLRPTYTTLTGPLPMRSAPALIQVADRELETDILTPINSPSRVLIGFQVLKQLDLALLKDRACFLEVAKKR